MVKLKIPQHLLRGGRIPLNIAPVYYIQQNDENYLFNPVKILKKQPRTLTASIDYDPIEQFYSQYPSYVTHCTQFQPYSTTFTKPKKVAKPGTHKNSKTTTTNETKNETNKTIESTPKHGINNPNTITNNNPSFKIWNPNNMYNALSLFSRNLWEYGGFAVSMNDIPNNIDLNLSYNFGEVCFAGKSNVGKSSLVNCVMNSDKENNNEKNDGKHMRHEIKTRDFHDGLAVVSSKPGRTRMLNFYTLDFYLSLVDCMGYGYAHVDNKIQQYWLKFMKQYFITRLDSNLKHVFILIDCSQIDWHLCLKHCVSRKRNENENDSGMINLNGVKSNIIKNHDWQMFDFLDSCFVPFSLIITKVDCIDQGSSLQSSYKDFENDNNTSQSIIDVMHDKYQHSWKFNLLLNEIETVYQRYAMIQPFINVTSSRLGFGITELQCLMGHLTGYFDNIKTDNFANVDL